MPMNTLYYYQGSRIHPATEKTEIEMDRFLKPGCKCVRKVSQIVETYKLASNPLIPRPSLNTFPSGFPQSNAYLSLTTNQRTADKNKKKSSLCVAHEPKLV
jgi:hypothetical protein